MQTYLINLEKDHARRAHMSSVLRQLELPYDLVKGVYGRDLSPSEIALHCDQRKAKWRQARTLTSAEIGCSLSHVKVYNDIVKRNVPLSLILEDDVVLPNDIKNLLDELEQLVDVSKPDVYLLSKSDAHSKVAYRLNDRREIRPFRSGFYASSYVVTKSAAERLLAYLYPVSHVADAWNRLSRFGIVDLWVVVPEVISQDQDTFGSSTTADVKELFASKALALPLYKVRRARNIVFDALSAGIQRSIPRLRVLPTRVPASVDRL